MRIDQGELKSTLDVLTERLLDERVEAGYWAGELSASALSTATAIIALTLAHRGHSNVGLQKLAHSGAGWLLHTQNDDGGWGDTVHSISNISTTVLCWAALSVEGSSGPEVEQAVSRARQWLTRAAGSLAPDRLAEAIQRRYGRDRTFSAPILTVLALSGLVGTGKEAWRRVPQLPFELVAFPQQWYRWFRLPVVSYALPALIAIGQARHRRRPSNNLAARWLRDGVSEATLHKLEQIQPAGGGFLEATPLTSFVVMSLIVAGLSGHPVVRRGLEFLERSACQDGSWPIDTNLATWVTTLSINALSVRPGWPELLSPPDRESLRKWLLGQQYRERHPYTGADPGGWAWTDLPGGVPDADDTPGALLALRALGGPDSETCQAATAGVRWLLDLQNSDGGIPTFCRGWGALPFDRSGPDLTAHALRAWRAWQSDLPPALAARTNRSIKRALRHLSRAQRADGAWQPLWFGNQFAPDDLNLTYGTARVLQSLASVPAQAGAGAAVDRGIHWLVTAQNNDGGWGGAKGVDSSIEETALAVSALADSCRTRWENQTDIAGAICRAVAWLVHTTDRGRVTEPSPIGFYFAKLWYFEKLYPLIFSVEALARARPYCERCQ